MAKRQTAKQKIGVNNVFTDHKASKIRTETSGWGAIKTLIIALLIAAQFVVMVYLYFTLTLMFNWYLVFSLVMTLLTCVYLLSSQKNSLSKAVWMLFLLVSFGFGYIIYLLSDERIFFRRPKKKYRKIFENAKKYEKEQSLVSEDSGVKLECDYLYKVGKFNAYDKTDLEYYPSGEILFEHILAELEKAEKFIFIEFFIISDGILLNRTFDILKRKADSGVEIRIIYDDMGSHRTLSRDTKKKFKDANIKLCPFNRLIPFFSVALNYRDHRKIVVIDGQVAFSGGSNLSDEYVNQKELHGYWKDTGIKICGEAVDSFSLMFLRQWEYVSGKAEDYSVYFNHYKETENTSVVIPYADGLDFDYRIGKSVYESVISNAKERVYIMTPYFILDDALTHIIMNKALSGVEVVLVLPGVPDKKYVYSVSRNNAEKLIDYGVKVYCVNDSFVHSKLVLTENAVVVGSINMDLRSFYQQFECALLTNDEKVMKEVGKDFYETLENSLLITEENRYRKNILNRVFSGFLQIFAPFM